MSATVSDRPTFVPCSGETWRDPFAMYAALRDHDPVHHVEHGDYWVLSRHADVFAAARDTTTFSSAQGLTFHYDDMATTGLDQVKPIVMLDPPDHTAFRRLVGRGFTPRQVNEIEPFVRDFAVERIEQLRAEGGGDIAAQLFKPMPSMVVAHYLGVPREDWPRFDRWTEAIVAANAEGDALAATDAIGELFEYFSALIERRRAEPADDTISQLAGADAADVSILQILGFAFTMVTGGNDTTTGMLGGAAELLTDRLDQRQLLLDAPGRISDAVEELLRLTAPVQGLARTTTTDVVLHDRTIPEGRRVLLLYGSANRDPRQYGPDAGELDVQRNPKLIMTFSYGAHHCLGAAAARLQARVALEELLTRCPRFTVDAAAGQFAPGPFIRRYVHLPFDPEGAA